jgi:hypothetical protein
MDLVPTDLAYAAGVVDSDGWIGVRRQRHADNRAWQAIYSPRIVVKQVTPQAPVLLKELFGGHVHTGAGTPTRRPLIAWETHSASAAAACAALLPYLRIKRAQAENAIEVGRMQGLPRRFALPEVDPEEPLLPLLEAAGQAGRSPAVAYQSASLGNVPCVRRGRQVFVPESFVPIWRDRPSSPVRAPEITARMEECYLRGKDLNHVGV